MDGKVILISGSSRGIGAATARLAKKQGATVILHGKTESQELKDLAKELGSEYIVCDVADEQAVKQEVARITKKVGDITSLVTSAGIVIPKPFLEADDENWLEQFKVNLLGTVHFVKAVLPSMIEKKYGRIVLISSIRGKETTSTNRGMAYSVSKAGVINLTSTLAKEYAPYIAVNNVAPGFTLSSMSNTWNDTVWKQVSSSLLGRGAEPQEIAEVIMFLASDKASFITGQTITPDGGYELAGK